MPCKGFPSQMRVLENLARACSLDQLVNGTRGILLCKIRHTIATLHL